MSLELTDEAAEQMLQSVISVVQHDMRTAAETDIRILLERAKRRSDVPRQQIAWVVIRDYDYEGDTLAGVHPTMEDAERQAEWMRKEYGETRVEQWQMGEMEVIFTPPSNSPRSDK